MTSQEQEARDEERRYAMFKHPAAPPMHGPMAHVGGIPGPVTPMSLAVMQAHMGGMGMDALMFPGMIGMSGGPGLGRPGLQMPRDIRGSQVQTMPRERMPLFGMPSCPPGPWAAPPVLSAMPRTQPAPDIKAGASVDTDSDSEKRQEKRNGSSNAQAERIARMQEKNRRAQRRFRERQKQKVSTLETRVEELQRENELYRAHGQNLQIRLTAMARAIELLDEECKAWSAGDKAKAEGARSLIQNLQNDTNSGLTLSVGGSTIPIEGARKLWSSHVAEAQRILGEAASEGADVTDEALLARAEATKEALVGVLLKLATQDPVTIKRFMASNAATGEEVSMDQATEQETVWGQRLPSLRLSDPQLFLAVSFRATYLSSLLEIHRERRRIQMRVHEACPEEFIGSHYMQLYSLKVHSLVHELHDNFNRETSANFTFVGNFYKSLLTPLQVLRLCSEAYPFLPDILALANQIYRKVSNDAGLRSLFHDSQGVPVPEDVRLNGSVE